MVRSLDLRLHAEVARLLHAHTGLLPRKLSVMTMTLSPLKPLPLPLRLDGAAAVRPLQFCSRCLADDAQPYFRRRWRLATRGRSLCLLRTRQGQGYEPALWRVVYFSETVDDYGVTNGAGDIVDLKGFTEEQLRVSLRAEIARQFTLEHHDLQRVSRSHRVRR
ncbi:MULTISPECIES: TniQ family protein [unclassified Ensifer]|uniref:TniQ family protein n=1 Tax=unclassified Ensifer TaxID=2633371 RepID=UPI001FCE2C53|nr:MULTISPECIES: TniQ family protein [unclassified Ensifer]